jgi:two-component system cell cycle sensor histidine kinase PleC
VNVLYSARKNKSLLSAYTADLGQLMSRRRVETALRGAAVESAMASKAKSEFLANMSHELRTPLNAIIGFGEMIEQLAHEDHSTDKPRLYASYIGQAGRHLLDVINDILNISEIESGTFALSLGPRMLSGIVDSSTVLVQRRMDEKQQSLIVRLENDLPPVWADELRLKQVLINLLSNSSKFTPTGGEISICARRAMDDVVEVLVSDTGVGMTPGEITLALKPFMQIHSSNIRKQEGTGLGLPIAKALVLKHGGRFEITSVPGAGTTVSITLKIADSHSAARAA